MVMQLLFAARVGRFDLLRIIGALASKITKWTKTCDKQQHKLMMYVQSSLGLRQIGYIGDDLQNLFPALFCDADFAGDKSTMRSTSGVHLAISGDHSNWPIIGISKRQEATSHSTPEAEMVAASFAVRQKGLPFMNIWDTIMWTPQLWKFSRTTAP